MSELLDIELFTDLDFIVSGRARLIISDRTWSVVQYQVFWL